MDSPKETELEARLARVEESLAALQRSMDALQAERSDAPAGGWAYRNPRGARRDPLADQVSQGRAA